jgi:tRNA(Ile2) C34 agmatinyltransferase TiaS
MIYIGLDDTDNPDSRGTGHLARLIAADLSADYPLAGVTRHQLFFDPRVPYTAKNSCAAILLDAPTADPAALLSRIRALMLAAFEPGSDPGLAVAAAVPPPISDFGRRAQTDIVTQADARALAAAHGIELAGLGGTEDGVIGALAAVGLAASGDDGRYVQVGHSRDLEGEVSIADVLAAGIDAVQTTDGQPVESGTVLVEKLRPARRGGRVVLFVEPAGDRWLPLKLD